MPLVGEAVPHRNHRVLGKLFDVGLSRAAVLDAVVEASQHGGSVGDGLLVAHLGTAGVQVGDVGALVVGADLEGAAGAGGGLFEDEGDVLAPHPLDLVAGVLGALEVTGQVEQELQFLLGEVVFLQEVTAEEVHGHERTLSGSDSSGVLRSGLVIFLMGGDALIGGVEAVARPEGRATGVTRRRSRAPSGRTCSGGRHGHGRVRCPRFR